MNERKADSEPFGIHRPPEPGRKFLPLGATSYRALQKGLPVSSQRPSSSIFTTSFVNTEIPKTSPTVRLPDIYTTCPELRQFKPIIPIPGMCFPSAELPSFEYSENKNSGLSSHLHFSHPSTINIEDKPYIIPETGDFDPNEHILKPYALLLL